MENFNETNNIMRSILTFLKSNEINQTMKQIDFQMMNCDMI